MSMQDQFNEAFEQGMKMNTNQSGTCTPHRWAAVIKAWADGKTIQCEYPGVHSWEDVEKDADFTPDFHSPLLSFRVKPKPKSGYIAINRISQTSEICTTADEAKIRLGLMYGTDAVAVIQITYTVGEGL